VFHSRLFSVVISGRFLLCSDSVFIVEQTELLLRAAAARLPPLRGSAERSGGDGLLFFGSWGGTSPFLEISANILFIHLRVPLGRLARGRIRVGDRIVNKIVRDGRRPFPLLNLSVGKHA